MDLHLDILLIQDLEVWDVLEFLIDFISDGEFYSELLDKGADIGHLKMGTDVVVVSAASACSSAQIYCLWTGRMSVRIVTFMS